MSHVHSPFDVNSLIFGERAASAVRRLFRKSKKGELLVSCVSREFIQENTESHGEIVFVWGGDEVSRKIIQGFDRSGRDT